MTDAEKRRLHFIVGCLLAICALALYHQRQIAPLLQRGLHSNDFKHIWIGARLLHLGESPYDEDLLFLMATDHGLGAINPYVYLPFTGLAMTPIAHFPFPQAVRIWFWVSHGVLGVAIGLVGAHLAGRRWWMAPLLIALGIAVAGCMMPLMRQLTAGQLNCVLALALAVILVSVERRWLWVAGLAVAFATLFKLSPGLFLLYLLWKRAWRLVGWTALWLALLMLWSLWQVGPGIHLEFLPLLADMRIGHTTWDLHGMAFHIAPANQAMGSFLLHVLSGEGGTQPWIDLGASAAHHLTLAFALAVLGGLIALTRAGWGTEGPPGEIWRAEWALVVVASLLIPSLMWDHYVVQLLPVLMVSVWGTATSEPVSLPQRLAIGLLWLLTAWLLTVYVSHWDPALQSGWGLAVMSVRLWAVLLMTGLLVWWRLRLAQLQQGSAELPQ